MNLLGLDPPFCLALGRSLLVGGIVAGLTLAVGWPLGVRIGLVTFPGRHIGLALLGLPALLPSFLVAIGLSMLWPGLGGPVGVVWTFACLGVPVVAFASMAATLSITRGQADAARLAGGECHFIGLASKAAFPLAGLAAALVGVLTLADPGPGQIFGWQGAAGEMLTGFAVRYDRGLATRQCLAVTILAALIAWPLAWRLAPEVAAGLFSRETNRLVPMRRPRIAAWLLGVVGGVTLVPLAGLLRPLLAGVWPVSRAWSEVARTGADTVVYAGLASGLAVATAFALAGGVGWSMIRRRVLVVAALALMALPPALPAVLAIPWSGHLAVGAVLALRGLPLAILFALRAVGSMPSSWADAAWVHRVPRWTFLVRVAVPWCARWAVPAGALSALLANAEIGTVLLLHPPGHGSLPLAVFTIMANAPEALVAMLCLLYVTLALAVAFAGQALARRL